MCNHIKHEQNYLICPLQFNCQTKGTFKTTGSFRSHMQRKHFDTNKLIIQKSADISDASDKDSECDIILSSENYGPSCNESLNENVQMMEDNTSLAEHFKHLKTPFNPLFNIRIKILFK